MKTTNQLKYAKSRIKKLFPQFKYKKFIVWYPQGTIRNVYCLQEYIGAKATKMPFGNIYYADLDLKDITN